MREYNVMMRARNLKNVDEDYKQHVQAWLNVMAGAMKQQGKKQVPVYKKFTDFYDYEEAIEEATKKANGEKEPSKFDRLSKHLKEKTK